PSEDAALGHKHVASGLRLPAKLAVGGAQESRELVGREAVVGGPALHLPDVVVSRGPGREAGFEHALGRPSARIAPYARHELALAVTGHRRPLPRQDGYQWQPAFIRWHGSFVFAAVSMTSVRPLVR